MARVAVALLALTCVSAQEEADDQQLIEALSVGELETLDADGFNMLHRAAGTGSLDFARRLVERGVDVDIMSQGSPETSSVQITALALAASKGHEDVVLHLLERRPSLDLAGALVLAASSGFASIVRLLLEAGAHVDQQSDDVNGASALGAASLMGQAETVTVLIAAGADPTLKDANGLSPLQAASRYAGQMQKNARMREAIESAGGGDHKTVTKLLRKALAAHSKKNDKAGKAQPDREL